MRALLFILLFAVAACSESPPPLDPEFEFLPPPTTTGRSCAAKCPAAKQSCDNVCEARHNTCRANLKLKAYKKHRAYVDERMAHGLLVKKTEADFWNEAVAAGCPAIPPCLARCRVELRYCHTKCGGQVKKGDTCYSNCTKTPTPFDEEEEKDDSWL